MRYEIEDEFKIFFTLGTILMNDQSRDKYESGFENEKTIILESYF